MRNSKAGMLFIFITVTIDMIGIGLVIPSLPDIMKRFVSSEMQVAEYFGYFVSIYAAMQFFASPLLGAMADRWGRRPVLLVSLFVAAADYVLMAFAPTLTILFIGRVLSGLTGANITVAMAYIADISTDKNRAANFGMIGAAFGLGFIAGPAIGGLVGHFGPHYPFLVAAALNLLNFAFGFFILPESLPPGSRRKINWGRVNPFSSLRRLYVAPTLAVLFLVYFFFQFAGHTHPSVWTLYTQTRYGWNTLQVGMSLAMVGVCSAIAQAWLTRLVVPRIGEYKTVFWGSAGYILAFIAYGSATQGWMLFPIIAVSSLMLVSGPALQSLLTAHTPPAEQGELQGTLVSLSALAAILCPLVVTKLFATFTTHPEEALYIPGMPYYFAAFICVLCLGALWFYKKKAS